MAVADQYANHRWLASTVHVRHGTDKRGIRVDTPDRDFLPKDPAASHGWAPGKWNVGMPYQWGGFDTPVSFDRKISRGLAAGDVYTLAKRAGLDAAVSREAAGIDCSGFISRCWGLERSYSTRELPSLCERLPGYDDLRPGDILNTHNAHVLLFAGWTDERRQVMWVYEAGCHPHWKVLRHRVTVDSVRQRGFIPWHYRVLL